MRITTFHIEKLINYSVFVTGFFGVAILAINLNIFTLFPYRILLLLLWGLFSIRLLTEGKVTLPGGKTRLYLHFFFIWIIYAIISLVWAESKVDCIRNIIFLFLGISVIFFTTYYFQDNSDLKKLFWIWFGAFWVLLFIGFWEHLTGQHLTVSRLYHERFVLFWHRPTGVFFNPNDYATFLAISIPFMFGATRYIKNRIIKIIGIIGILAAFYLIVVTGSRANTLAVIIEMIFVVLFLTNLTQKLKIAFAALIIFVATFQFLPINLFSTIVCAEISSLTSRMEVQTGSVGIRTNLARNCFDFITPTAGLGVGAGNVEHWMEHYAIHNTYGIVNAHNWWLEILTNYGIFIFTGYIALYLWLILRLWRHWHRIQVANQRLIVEVLLLALIGFPIASISSSSIMAFEPNWMLFAFALAYLHNQQKQNQLQDEIK